MMKSSDIEDLFLQMPQEDLAEMAAGIHHGVAVWFVDADTSSGNTGLFRSESKPEGGVVASAALHALTRIPWGQLWIAPADNVHIDLPPGLGLGAERN